MVCRLLQVVQELAPVGMGRTVFTLISLIHELVMLRFWKEGIQCCCIDLDCGLGPVGLESGLVVMVCNGNLNSWSLCRCLYYRRYVCVSDLRSDPLIYLFLEKDKTAVRYGRWKSGYDGQEYMGQETA
jgi:hypothetical protein